MTVWSTDRQLPISFGDSYISPNPVSIGQEAFVHRTLIVHREGCEGRFRREIVDSSGRVFSYSWSNTTFSNRRVGTYQITNTVPIIIPNGARPGKATLYTIDESACNPIHKLFPLVHRPAGVPFVITTEQP
jgi:hypothetical protein